MPTPIGRFSTLYQGRTKPAISFEVFPPKTDAAYDHLREVLPELISLQPDFMTVTYGAFGTTRSRTLEIAEGIQKDFKVPTACHLTCVGSSQSELDQILEEIHGSGIRNIVALRGDPPQGQTTFTAAKDGYSHANELVAHIRRKESQGFGPFGIAVAGYPEKHVEASSLEADIANLKRKVDAGGDCVITQLFYNNEFYFRFVEKARAAGIQAPIIPGLLPVLSAKQVLRITSICGSCLPADLKNDLDEAGEDLSKAEDVGVRQCVRQARELLAKGAPGIHFYVLNKSSHMKRIMQEIA
jgi:methylenetetrahydrofolate reductase (NADPH)